MQTIKFRTEYTPVRENFTLNPEKPVLLMGHVLPTTSRNACNSADGMPATLSEYCLTHCP